MYSLLFDFNTKCYQDVREKGPRTENLFCVSTVNTSGIAFKGTGFPAFVSLHSLIFKFACNSSLSVALSAPGSSQERPSPPLLDQDVIYLRVRLSGPSFLKQG